MTLGRLSFVQIISREQTVAMETVVSDVVGKATSTCVEERTKLSTVRGSQSIHKVTPLHTHTHTHTQVYTHSPSLRKAHKRLSLLYFSL